MTLIIHTDNVISIDGRQVGRINQTKCGYNHGPAYQIFSTKKGTWTPHGNEVDQHKIFEPAYIGSGSNLAINPKFEDKIKEAINEYL